MTGRQALKRVAAAYAFWGAVAAVVWWIWF